MKTHNIDVLRSQQIKKYFERYSSLSEADAGTLSGLLSETLLNGCLDVRIGLKSLSLQIEDVLSGIENLLHNYCLCSTEMSDPLINLFDQVCEKHKELIEKSYYIQHNIQNANGNVYEDFNLSIIYIMGRAGEDVDEYYDSLLTNPQIRHDMHQQSQLHPYLLNEYISKTEAGIISLKNSIRTISKLSSDKALESKAKNLTGTLLTCEAPNENLANTLLSIMKHTASIELLDQTAPELIKSFSQSNHYWHEELATELSHIVINNKAQLQMAALTDDDINDINDWNERLSNSTLSL